ncbi:integrase, catalytic region, zinc finger, CCHC-type containing protein [Tanacetum coccineum]
MTTLADKSLLSGGDNKPPMLEKHLYDSWKSRMELYMMNRPHGRMILASVEKGPLVWPSITEDGVTRLKEYVELTPAEAIQADCDIKAINIILQGLPTEIYALVSQHRVAKDLWEKIKPDARNREQTTYAAGTTRKYTPGASGSNTGKQRTVICYNCKGEGHIAKQCTKPKRKRDETWFNDKVYWVYQLKQGGQALTEEEIAFLANPGLPDIQTSHTINQPTMAAYSSRRSRSYDSDCEEHKSSKDCSHGQSLKEMARSLTEVHNPDNLNYDLFNQSEQIMTSSEQSNDVSQTETDITSDSNIIPYSQYLSETQQETVQNSNSSAQQDSYIYLVRLSTSASGSQPSRNTKNDRILQTQVNLKKQDNSDYVCVNSNDCMSSDNLCVSNSLNVVKFRAKPKKNKSKKDIWKPTGKVFTQIGYIWRPTGRTFTIVGNACPLTRITTTNEVPSRKPIVLDSEYPKLLVQIGILTKRWEE